jgi:hypothetical protein
MGWIYWGEANNPANRSQTTTTGTGTRQHGSSSAARRDLVDLHDYFLQVGPYRGPMGPRWTERDWRNSPAEQVPLDAVCATQNWISADGLRHHHRRGARPDGGDLPWVVCHRRRYYVLDGHHRVVTAIDRGESHITAHVKHPAAAPARRPARSVR